MGNPAFTNQTCFVLVPGAKPYRHLPFGADAVGKSFDTNKWYSDGFALVSALKKAAPGGNVQTFEWSGLNTQRHRYESALELSALLKGLNDHYKEIFVVGHSHGGNVALMAAKISGLPRIHIVTLGTPFVVYDCSKISQRIGMLYVIFTLILMLTVGYIIASLAMPIVALVYVLIHGLLFGATLFWWNIHERATELLSTEILSVTTYFQHSVASYPADILTIFYADDGYLPRSKDMLKTKSFRKRGKDWILLLSDILARSHDRSRQRQNDSNDALSVYERFLNLTTIGLCLLAAVVVIYVSTAFGAGIYALYALLCVLFVFVIYLSLITIFFGFHITRILKHELEKFYHKSFLSTFSVRENLFVSTSIQEEPVVADNRVLLKVVRLPLDEDVKDSHSDICFDPRAIKEIEQWIEERA
ncbi:MAG: hypothetical protein ACR65U_00445 [Methylocystis sp.]